MTSFDFFVIVSQLAQLEFFVGSGGCYTQNRHFHYASDFRRHLA